MTLIDLQHTHARTHARTHTHTHTHLAFLLVAHERVLFVHHPGGDHGHENTVAHIAEHDGEKEGETDDREQRRVHLLVRGDTVRVNDVLCGGRREMREV